MQIHQIIRSKRKELKITQQVLSEEIKISKGNISRFENGYANVLSYNVIVKICQYLGIKNIPIEININNREKRL